ncbi:MAG: hypothetical protein HRU26_16185 [Psychroserpens sp.]|nr:hypothetical protein [Psychroserpens sp.]
MKAVSTKVPFDFVCSFEDKLPKEEKTVFKCLSLTADQEAALDNIIGYQATDGSGYVLTMGKSNLLALHMGLVEIENLPDGKGGTIKIERDNKLPKVPGGLHPIKQSILDQIRKDARDEIALEIKSGAKLGDSDSKNS